MLESTEEYYKAKWARQTKENAIIWSCISVLAVLILSIGAGIAKMKSDTYNRLTGANTTWWDAVWVELRVQNTTH